jgi:hypothetical protein
MPTTRYSDLPQIVKTLFINNDTEYSITLPGQCFGITISISGQFQDIEANRKEARIAFEPGIVATGSGNFITLYRREQVTATIPLEKDRYSNFSNKIFIPRNKFIRDLTVYGAFVQTSPTITTSHNLGLQAIYWTTPTP